jgi:hypothetical protein
MLGHTAFGAMLLSFVAAAAQPSPENTALSYQRLKILIEQCESSNTPPRVCLGIATDQLNSTTPSTPQSAVAPPRIGPTRGPSGSTGSGSSIEPSRPFETRPPPFK